MKRALVITSIVIGILFGLQVRSFKKVEFLIQRSEPASFLAELRTLQIANADLRQRLGEEEKMLQDLKSTLVKTAVEEEIKSLELLSGQKAVQGEGIEISLNVNIKSFWLTDMIAQLVSSGAEAMAINGYRITERTAGLRDIGQGLLMRRNYLLPPFKISVIGPSNELAQSISQNGGIIDRIKKSVPGIDIRINKSANIVIPAVTD